MSTAESLETTLQQQRSVLELLQHPNIANLVATFHDSGNKRGKKDVVKKTAKEMFPDHSSPIRGSVFFV